MTSTNKVVANALAVNEENGIVKEFRHKVISLVQELLQKIGDTKNAIYQESEIAKYKLQKYGNKGDSEKFHSYYRSIDSNLDMVASIMKKIIR